MSRQLPTRPNLDHLRKQAKHRLEALRRAGRGANLADALHAIARDYGFTTWPRLKAHVESLAAGPAASGPGAAPTLTGTWDADPERSTPHPLNAFQTATLQFAVDGDVVTIDDVVRDESGRTERNSNTLHADGRVRTGPHGYSTVARWHGDATLEAVVRRDDRIEAVVVYAVAADGQTLTLTAGEYVAVFQRRRTDDTTPTTTVVRMVVMWLLSAACPYP